MNNADAGWFAFKSTSILCDIFYLGDLKSKRKEHAMPIFSLDQDWKICNKSASHLKGVTVFELKNSMFFWLTAQRRGFPLMWLTTCNRSIFSISPVPFHGTVFPCVPMQSVPGTSLHSTGESLPESIPSHGSWLCSHAVCPGNQSTQHRHMQLINPKNVVLSIHFLASSKIMTFDTYFNDHSRGSKYFTGLFIVAIEATRYT